MKRVAAAILVLAFMGPLESVIAHDDGAAEGARRAAGHAGDEPVQRSHAQAVTGVARQPQVAKLAHAAQTPGPHSGGKVRDHAVLAACAADDDRTLAAASQHANAGAASLSGDGVPAQVETQGLGIGRRHNAQAVAFAARRDNRVVRADARIGYDRVAARAGNAPAVHVVAAARRFRGGGGYRQCACEKEKSCQARNPGAGCTRKRHVVPQIGRSRRAGSA